MIYTTYSPKSFIRKYIQNFWYCKVDATNTKTIFPKPYPVTSINLGPMYELHLGAIHPEVQLVQSGFIAGIQKQLVSYNHPLYESVGIDWMPGGLYPFVNKPISMFTNAYIDIDLVYSDVSVFKQNVQKVNTTKEMFELLEQFLIRKYWGEHSKSLVIESVIGMLQDNPDTTLKQMSSTVHFSPKHIITLIKQSTGTTPKHLAQLYKLQKITDIIQQERPLSLKSLMIKHKVSLDSAFCSLFSDCVGLPIDTYIQAANKA